MKSKLVVSAILASGISFASAAVPGPCEIYGTHIRDYALVGLALYHPDSVVTPPLQAVLRTAECVGTITKAFFVSEAPGPAGGGPTLAQQETLLKNMLREMADNIENIPPEAFRLNPEECGAIVAVANDDASGPMLADSITGDQLEAIPLACAKDFDLNNFDFRVAKHDLLHRHQYYTNTDPAFFSTEVLQHTSKLFVQKYFDDRVCGALTSEQLTKLGDQLADPIRGTRGITSKCLVSIGNDKWDAINDADITEIVKELPVDAFSNMGAQALPEHVVNKLSAAQLADYDKNNATPCSALNLNHVDTTETSGLRPECFAKALEAGPVTLDLGFFTNARVDIFSKIGKPEALLNIDLNSGAWRDLQAPHLEHIWALVKGDIKKHRSILEKLAETWKVHHEGGTSYLITNVKKENLSKLPWQMLNSEHVLQQLGPTKIQAVGKDLLTQQGAIGLYDLSAFRAAMTPSQFTSLFCNNDRDCGNCKNRDASTLKDVSRATLKTIPSACISNMPWAGITPEDAKAIVPHLGDKAFEAVTQTLPKEVLANLRGAQMSDFDSNEKDDPCSTLSLENVPARLSKFMRPRCFAVAFRKNPSVNLEKGFILRANKNLLDEVDADEAAELLKEAQTWSDLTAEQLAQMIAKDVDYCTLVKAPPQGKPAHLPLLTHACVKLIDPEELVKLLSTSAIKVFQEDSLKAVTSDVKEVEKILKPVGAANPKLLEHLGADSEGDNPCSLLELQKVVKEYPVAAKYLPKNCFAAMTGLGDVQLADLKKLPEAAQEAVPVKDIIEHMEGNDEFDRLKDSEWSTFMASPVFCKAASTEILHKNKKFVQSLNGPCYSALSFELEDGELKALAPSVVAQASDDAVAKHAAKYSTAQIGALSANIKKLPSINALSTEQTGAITVAAMKHVSPAALADLDTDHLHAISPDAFGALAFDQLSKVPATVVLTLTPDQARNLGKHVEDKAQDPHRLFTPELHSKLSPELQKLIAVASGASMVQVSIAGVCAAVIATAAVILA